MAYKKPKTKAELKRAVSQLSKIKDNRQVWSSFGANVKRALSRRLNEYIKQLDK